MTEEVKYIDQGGNAFPLGASEYGGYGPDPGMTIRDWFAGQADVPWNAVLDTLSLRGEKNAGCRAHGGIPSAAQVHRGRRNDCRSEGRVMTIIATDTDQIVLCIRMEMAFMPLLHTAKPRIWQGCLEVERKEYTAKDILHLADDKPENIVKVWRICMTSGQCDDLTDLVLEAADD